jgi:hypothetical protein
VVTDKLMDAIVATVYRVVRKELGGMRDAYLHATFLATETDATLSRILLTGDIEEARWVRKLAHVTGLTAGDTVLCVKGPTTPLTIIGKISGDITQAATS